MPRKNNLPETKPENFTTKGKKLVKRTDKEIMTALTATRGAIYRAAKVLGMVPNTLKTRIYKNLELYDFYQSINIAELENAENKLLEKVDAGDMNAIMFYLKSKGAPLGYFNEMTIKMQGQLTSTQIKADLGQLSMEELQKLYDITEKLDYQKDTVESSSDDGSIIEGTFAGGDK